MNLKTKENCFWQDIQSKEKVIGLVKINLITLLMGWLFFSNLKIMTLLILPGNIFGRKFWKKRILKEKEEQFMDTFKESLIILADALKVGYAFPNAIEETYRNLLLIYPKDTRICREYKQMMSEIRLNKPIKYVLKGFSKRIPHEDIISLVDVLVIAQKSGGNLVEIMERSIRWVCDKVRVKQEIEILFAAKRLEFHVLCIIPLGILFYLRYSIPMFTSILYGNIWGIVFMGICLVFYIMAFLLGERLVSVDV